MSPASSSPGRRRALLLAAVVVGGAFLAGVAAAGGAPGASGAAAADSPDVADAGDTPFGDAAAGPLAQDDGAALPACAAEPPSDYAHPEGGTDDTVGFVDGYWYGEPVEFDASDGLSDAEIERLTARTAARTEALRCLTLEEGLPPVNTTDRDALSDEVSQQFGDVSEDAARFDNAVLSTMLLVGHDTDSIDERQEARSATIGGFYDPETDEIVVVRGDGGGSIDESVLAHELVHALQDQRFGLGDRPRNVTSDREAGQLGLIEGDASLVEHRYSERCDSGAWAAGCPTLEGGDGGQSGDGEAPPNWGLYLQQFQPYADGPSFVQGIYEDGGWSAVNDRYGEYPESSLSVMSPETAGTVEIEHPEVDVDSSGDWERLAPPEWPGYETVGPAGIAAMVIAPTYESGSETNIVSPLGILNLDDSGEVDEFDPLNYDQEPVEGWRGDRLATFTQGDETATVWRSAWANETDAGEFLDAYRQLLEFRGAAPIENGSDRYRFGEDSSYEGAVSVVQDGDTVRIVTAPSADAIDELAASEEADDESAPIPGFGVVPALVGALAAVLALAARRR